MAAAISSGCDDSDCWNALAVPWKPPRTVTGTPNSAIAALIASVACDRDTPRGRLKLMVDAGAPLWWFTANGVFVVSTRANDASGTCAPELLVTYSRLSVSGPCRNSGASSITTRYWLSGL